MNKLRYFFQRTDWKFLLAMILLVNVQYSFKLVGFVFLLVLLIPQRHEIFRQIKQLKIPQSVPKFFLLMLFFTIFYYIFSLRYFDSGQITKIGMSAILWGMLYVVSIGFFLMIERDYSKVSNTIIVFFLLNIGISLLEFGFIYLQNGGVNPYSDLGVFSMSTGDHINGITRNSSHFNAIINLFGFIYFLDKKKYFYALLALLVVLLINSNVTTVIVILYLVVYFFREDKFEKLITLALLVIIVVFFIRISPQNFVYVVNTFDKTYYNKLYHQREADTLNRLRQEQIRDSIIKSFTVQETAIDSLDVTEHIGNTVTNQPQIIAKTGIDSIPIIIKIAEATQGKTNNAKGESTRALVYKNRTLVEKYTFKAYPNGFSAQDSAILNRYPLGKLTSFMQTIQFSFSNIKHFLIGNGPGNFSSKLAFKKSGVLDKDTTKLNEKNVNPYFKENHLKLYCYFFSKDLGEHSIIKAPFSSFNQILGEYGMFGVLLFLATYVFFFLKRIKTLTYGNYLLFILVPILMIDYFFEEMTIIFLFELLMLLDLKKEKKIIKSISNENS